MAFPFIAEENYETGTKGSWDTETDTDGVLDFAHYTELARFPWSQCAPWRGAYCVRIALNGGTNDATLTEGAHDIADGSTASLRFFLYFGLDFNATATDVMSLYEWQQAGGTVEATMGLRLTAVAGDLCTIEIGVGDGTAPSAYAAQMLVRNRWYCIEATLKCSTGGSGTITLYIDGASSVALTSQTHAAAIGQGVLGAQLHLATTTGTILLDWFTFDDLRLYPPIERWPTEQLLTMSGHVFVGEGEIANVALLKVAAADMLTLYDTDRGITNDATNTSVELQSSDTVAALVDPAGMPITVKRGAYIALTGTTARARVNICRARQSAALIRNWGQRHVSTPLEV